MHLSVKFLLAMRKGALFNMRRYDSTYIILEFAETIVLPVAAHLSLVLGFEAGALLLHLLLLLEKAFLPRRGLVLQLLPRLRVVTGLVWVESDLGCLWSGDESRGIEPLVRLVC